MREILFRGKRIDNGEWVEGYITEHTMMPHDLQSYIGWVIECKETKLYEHNWYEVDPVTVGQYTGLRDKNGRRIFEGDIVRVTDDEDDTQFSDGGIGRVAFDYGLWYVHGAVSNSLYDVSNVYHTEVIGNKWDNPEWLEAR